MDSAWLLSLRVPQAPRSNTDPHVVAECPQPLACLHVPWRKLVWARPDDDFPEAAQANVRNCPVVAADRVPESGRNTSVAPDNVVQQYPSGQHNATPLSIISFGVLNFSVFLGLLFTVHLPFRQDTNLISSSHEALVLYKYTFLVLLQAGTVETPITHLNRTGSQK